MFCQKLQLMGFSISTEDPSEIAKKCCDSSDGKVVNTLNPHSYVEQKNDYEFQKALKSSDYLLPDGSGIVLAAMLLAGKRISKVAGYEVFLAFMRYLNKAGGRCCFLGSTEQVLDKIASRVSNDFSRVKTSFLSPPFKPNFSASDIAVFSSYIKNENPDIVFVGLTAPKQEKLVAELFPHLQGVTFVSIGAVFDFYAGTVRRPSDFWVSLHLEWLVRFIGEPKRLWRRNFISTPIFLWDMMILFMRGLWRD